MYGLVFCGGYYGIGNDELYGSQLKVPEDISIAGFDDLQENQTEALHNSAGQWRKGRRAVVELLSLLREGQNWIS